VTRAALARWAPAALAVLSVVVVVLRTSQGLAEFLVDSLSPAETMALGSDAERLAHGFPSGAELTAISAPLRLYAVFDAFGLGVVGATRVMIALEALALFAGIYFAARIMRPTTSTLVAALAATVGTVGFAMNGHNLSNFGFVYGWNYGFSAAAAVLALAFALRTRWTECACTIVGVALIHSVVAVLVALSIVPLATIDVVRHRFRLRWRPVALSAAVGVVYVAASLGDVQPPGGRLDAGAYIARVRAFQFHYFFRFSTSFLRPYAEDIASWLVAVVLVAAACLALRRLGDQSLSDRTLVVVATVGGLSALGWAHSYLAQPNVTLLVLTLHRSSVFVNLLLLALVVPLLFDEVARARLLATAAAVTVWCLLPDPVDHARLGMLVLVLAVWWLATEVRQQIDRRSVATAAVVAPVAGLAMYFLIVSPGIAGPGWRAFARGASDDRGLIVAGAVLVALALYARQRDTGRRRLGRGMATSLTVACAVAALLGRSVTDNPLALTGVAKARRDDLIDVASWARTATAEDDVVLLPLTDDGFGWRTFSHRASAGKPREWLHYSFLYSRDERVMDEGTRRADLLGVDVDAWLAQHPQLGVGGELVAELATRFQRMTDEQAAKFADELGADFLVVEADAPRSSPCFRTVHSNATYVVLEVHEECR
jgi:hypothetical protein